MNCFWTLITSLLQERNQNCKQYCNRLVLYTGWEVNNEYSDDVCSICLSFHTHNEITDLYPKSLNLPPNAFGHVCAPIVARIKPIQQSFNMLINLEHQRGKHYVWRTMKSFTAQTEWAFQRLTATCQNQVPTICSAWFTWFQHCRLLFSPLLIAYPLPKDQLLLPRIK